MDFSNIYDKVEENRPLSLISSLPVIVEKNNHLEVVWFNFSFTKNAEEGITSVHSIFTTEDSETITEENVEIEEQVKRCENEEPAMDEEDYYEQLEQLYLNFDAGIMQILLQQAVFKPFLKTYETVMNYIANTQETEEVQPEKLLN